MIYCGKIIPKSLLCECMLMLDMQNTMLCWHFICRGFPSPCKIWELPVSGHGYMTPPIKTKMGNSHTVFFKTRGHLLIWAPPCLASSGLVWPCLAMPCHVSCCLAWVWTWRFFVNYQKRDSYSRVVLLCIFNFSINWVCTADNNMGKI